MKIQIKTMLGIALISLITPPHLSEAGQREGNGGIGIVCRDVTGKITSAQLLDLVEAEAVDGLKIPHSPQNGELQALKAIQNIHVSQVRHLVSDLYAKYLPTTRFIHASFSLPDTHDFNPRIGVKNCKYETIALFDDVKDQLTIDGEIYAALDVTATAALMVHEIIYKYARMRGGATDSNLVRKIVGQLFAAKRDPKKLLELLEDTTHFNRFECEFWTFNDPVQFRFSKVFDLKERDSTVTIADGKETNDLPNGDHTEVKYRIDDLSTPGNYNVVRIAATFERNGKIIDSTGLAYAQFDGRKNIFGTKAGANILYVFCRGAE
jgi:hypothetical protein